MKRHEFLQELRINGSPRGKRVDLAFYIYPNGYGNVYNLAASGKWAKKGRDEITVPFVDIQDALQVVRGVLEVRYCQMLWVRQRNERILGWSTHHLVPALP